VLESERISCGKAGGVCGRCRHGSVAFWDVLQCPPVLVLGVWGCGDFGNDPRLVAGSFEEALEGELRGADRDVLFAIYDAWEGRRTIQPFLERYGG
jgi:uncharacterized protein (TIGR02452 family)